MYVCLHTFMTNFGGGNEASALYQDSLSQSFFKYFEWSPDFFETFMIAYFQDLCGIFKQGLWTLKTHKSNETKQKQEVDVPSLVLRNCLLKKHLSRNSRGLFLNCKSSFKSFSQLEKETNIK